MQLGFNNLHRKNLYCKMEEGEKVHSMLQSFGIFIFLLRLNATKRKQGSEKSEDLFVQNIERVLCYCKE